MSFKKLLQLEYNKFKNNSVVKLLLIFYMVLAPTLILLGKRIFVNVPPPLPSNSIFYEFTTVWDYQGFVGSWLIFFFLGYFSLYIVTNEITNKTLRQNIITGLTRKEFFLGKFYVILTISLLSTLLYAISCIVLGIIHTEGWNISLLFDNNLAILRFFLLCMGYMSFGLFIGFLIRKSGLAIFAYFAYILIIESVIKWAVLLNTIARIDSIPNWLVNYVPMNVIEDLMPNPLLKFPGNFMQSSDINFELLLPTNAAIIGSIVYIIVFLGLSWLSFSRRDI